MPRRSTNGLIGIKVLVPGEPGPQAVILVISYQPPSSTTFNDMSLLFLLPTATAIIAIYCAITHIRQAAKAKRLGCEAAPLFRPWDILGVQNFKIELNGMKKNRLSNAFSSRKNEMSAKVGRDCKTFRIKYPPGETWYYTFDPKNLQAVLATQFQDFQQPAARVGAFEPLLGLGIVRFATHHICRADFSSSRPMDLNGNILERFCDHSLCVNR